MNDDGKYLKFVDKKVKKRVDGAWVEAYEQVVHEKALTIYVNESELTTIICSPWDLKNMVIGFLVSEGIIKEKEKLKKISLDEEKGLAYVEIEGYENNISGKLFLKRYITPCCGRGRASFYYSSDAMICKVVNNDIKIPAQAVQNLADELERKSLTFKKTGGVHCSGLANENEILIFCEDVGRHNTLDKIYGKCYMENIRTDDKILVFSGRVSSEILLKTAKMSVPILISRSAPTELALDLAEDLGVTVVGFSRDNKFTVYTHTDRIY